MKNNVKHNSILHFKEVYNLMELRKGSPQKKARQIYLFLFLCIIFISSTSLSNGASWNLEDKVVEFVLDNGFTILVIERQDTPLAFCNVYYNVGSVRERPGITGISHLLEHMMFKGTKTMGVKDYAEDLAINNQINDLSLKLYHEKFWKFHPDLDVVTKLEAEIALLLEREKEYLIKDEYWGTALREGATFVNASTSQDWTGYYLTLPANKVELQMVMESDRMVNAFFREFYTEKEVVREERRLSENSPGFFFTEHVLSTFFTASPYSWHVLGWDADLQKLTHEDLIRYYKKYYVPNNALAVYIGDVDAKQVIELARKHFGHLPRGEAIEPVRTVEPLQHCEKRLYDHQAQKNKVTMLYHIPRLAHEDTPVLKVLGQVLSGKSGRLTKRLVEKEKVATTVSVLVDSLFFDGAFEVTAELRQESGRSLSDLEQMMTEEINKCAENVLSDEEVAMAKNQIISSFLRSLRKPWVIVQHLASYQFATGSWRNLQLYLDDLENVSAAEILEVSQKYFPRNNRLVGIEKTKNEENVSS